MPQGFLAPGRPWTVLAVFVKLTALALVVGACSLNQSPIGQMIVEGPPNVRLTSPLPNATYLEGVAVNIQAYVTNAGADVDRVEITIDDTIVATLPEPNPDALPAFSLTHSWPAAGVGPHRVGVTAFRSDGSASETASESFTVISPSSLEEPTATPQPTATPESEDGDEGEGGGDGEGGDGEEPAATNTPSRPVATFNQGVNVRSGPGTNFNPPIGSFAAGQTADVLGVNPAGDWYKVRYYNAEGWVFASLLTVSGDTENLPVDPGPPTPIPATATPIPPTPVPASPVPQSQANLVAGNIRLEPAQPRCGETFNVEVDIANLGSQATTTTGTFSVQDVHVATGNVTTSTQGPIPIIQPGQTVASAEIPLTVNAYYEEEHKIVVVLNPSGGIPETGAGDNRRELSYTLRKAGCG